MLKILIIAAVVAISLGLGGAASAAELSVTRGPWTCTVVYVDNNGNGHLDFGDVIVSANCIRTFP